MSVIQFSSLLLLVFFNQTPLSFTEEVSLGYFQGTRNNVQGEVNIVDPNRFKIYGFVYDGKASAVFFMGMKLLADARMPYSAQGIAFEHGSSASSKNCERLSHPSKGEDIEIFVPSHLTVLDFNMLAVYDYQKCTTLGYVKIPEDVDIAPVENGRKASSEACLTYLVPCSRMQTLKQLVLAKKKGNKKGGSAQMGRSFGGEGPAKVPPGKSGKGSKAQKNFIGWGRSFQPATTGDDDQQQQQQVRGGGTKPEEDVQPRPAPKRHGKAGGDHGDARSDEQRFSGIKSIFSGKMRKYENSGQNKRPSHEK